MKIKVPGMLLRPKMTSYVSNQQTTHSHVWESTNLAFNLIYKSERPSLLVRKGQFAAFDDGGRFSGVKSLPGIRIPIFPLNCNSHMLVNGPKDGPAAGLHHEVFNVFVDSPDQWEKVFS